MSRIGKKIIILPKGVTANVNDLSVSIEGPKGKMSYQYQSCLDVKVESSEISVLVKNDVNNVHAFHGLTRSLLNNMVMGVSVGFQKILEIKGVGYKAAIKGKTLTLNLGYSHPIEIDFPNDIEVKIDGPTKIIITGICKQKVGHYAALVRSQRSPEPFKGKGIRYIDEVIKLKAGKSAGK